MFTQQGELVRVFEAIELIVAHCDEWSRSCSNTIRTARLADLRWVSAWSCHRSILSRTGASNIPGAVQGVFLRAWGEFGVEPGQFKTPIGLQIGPEGNVWVVGSLNERVQVFTQQGELVRVFDDVGPGPQIVSINAGGEFYVSSPWAESRVRRFSTGGELLGYLGYSVTREEVARMTIEEAARVIELSTLSGPHGTATDPSGAVYVADTANGIVRKFVPVTQ